MTRQVKTVLYSTDTVERLADYVAQRLRGERDPAYSIHENVLVMETHRLGEFDVFVKVETYLSAVKKT